MLPKAASALSRVSLLQDKANTWNENDSHNYKSARLIKNVRNQEMWRNKKAKQGKQMDIPLTL